MAEWDDTVQSRFPDEDVAYVAVVMGYLDTLSTAGLHTAALRWRQSLARTAPGRRTAGRIPPTFRGYRPDTIRRLLLIGVRDPALRAFWEGDIRATLGRDFHGSPDNWIRYWQGLGVEPAAIAWLLSRHPGLEDPEAAAITYLDQWSAGELERALRATRLALQPVLSWILTAESGADPAWVQALEAERAELRARVEALTGRVAELERQLAAERADAAAAVRILADSHAACLKRLSQPGTAPAAPPLLGARVLVVGDPGHRHGYRAILQHFGATDVRFADGITSTRLPQGSWDLVVEVTAWAKHRMDDQLALLPGVPVVAVTAGGLGAFRRTLSEWLTRTRSRH